MRLYEATAARASRSSSRAIHRLMGDVASLAGRAVVTCEGPGELIVLTVYGPDGKAAAVPLLPKRALTLAQELLTRGVQAIKADWWGPE